AMAESSSSADPPSVLLVGGAPDELSAIADVLASLGAPIERATPREASARIDAGDVAVVMIDVQSSGGDGLETVRLIKARERGRVVPIIFVTTLERDRRRVTTAY